MKQDLYLPKTISNFGYDVRDCDTYDDVVSEAKLDYDVAKLRLVTEEFNIPTNQFALVNTDTQTLYCTCTDRYTLAKHADIFKTINTITKYGYTFCRAGELESGTALVVVRKDEPILIDGQYCYFYLMLSNSYNGKDKVMIKFVPVINGVFMPLLDDMNYEVKHVGDFGTSDISESIAKELDKSASLYGGILQTYNNADLTDSDFLIAMLCKHYSENIAYNVYSNVVVDMDNIESMMEDASMFGVGDIFFTALKRSWDIHKSLFTNITKLSILYVMCREFDSHYVIVDNNKHLKRLLKETKTKYLNIIDRL